MVCPGFVAREVSGQVTSRNGVCMDRARFHAGIRRMRFTDALGRSERSELSQMEAAELLGISERTSIICSVICSTRRPRRG